jgi:hypothetical protein
MEVQRNGPTSVGQAPQGFLAQMIQRSLNWIVHFQMKLFNLKRCTSINAIKSDADGLIAKSV